MPIDKPIIKRNASKKKEKEEENIEFVNDDNEGDEEAASSDEENQEEAFSEGEGSDYDEEEVSSTPQPIKPLKQVVQKKKNEKQSIEVKKQSQKRKPAAENGSQNTRKIKIAKRKASVEMENLEAATIDDKNEETSEEPSKKNGTGSVKKYNDNNIHYNLYNEAPENIVECRVKLTSSCLITSRMIEANGEVKGLTYDMAALVICRKMKNGSVFEFTLPLSLAPSICQAIGFIMKENKQFFNKKIPIPICD